MATIKVKRSPESKGRCKLAYNKVYNAQINSFYKDSYIIGNNVYLKKWFTTVADKQPKPKPVLKPDPKTGKFVVENQQEIECLNLDHSITEPEPFDIREVIAEYIRKFGTELTAIELIGHLTIDAKWQSTEK